jgi:hypothetical protein
MKKVLFFVSALVVGIGFVNAKGTVTSNSVVSSITQDDKEKIKTSELPEAIKTTLNGDEYKGWLIQSAHRYKSQDLYEVELKKGAESKTIKFDKEGKVIV